MVYVIALLFTCSHSPQGIVFMKTRSAFNAGYVLGHEKLQIKAKLPFRLGDKLCYSDHISVAIEKPLKGDK